MKKLFFYLALSVLWLFSCSEPVEPKTNAAQDRQSIRASFLPENDWHKNEYYAQGEVTEDDFDAVLEAAKEIYGPILSDLGLTLHVYADWSSRTVNAYCNREGNNVEISFFGGLARHPKMTMQGFALVVCHEIGHAVGGIPVYSSSKWASNEGQSDYFATAACARKMFDPSSPLRLWGTNIWKRRTPDDTTQPDSSQGQCYFGSSVDRDICQHSLNGGLSLGAVLADLNGETMPRYETPSKVVVSKMMEKHPPAQCRLDSYRAGALCQKNWDDSIIPSNKSEENRVSCAKPRCWYKP